MTTFAASPDPAVSARAIVAVVRHEVIDAGLTGADMRDVWRIVRDTALYPSPAERVAQHLDLAEDNEWLAVNRAARPGEPLSYRDAAALHRRWAAVYASVLDLRARQDAVAAAPLQAPVSGVPCMWCQEDNGWACVRVWDEDSASESFDLEVCPGCAAQLLVGAPDSVASEPMTEDDYARHGLPAGPQLPSEWDSAAALLAVDFGDDALHLDGVA